MKKRGKSDSVNILGLRIKLNGDSLFSHTKKYHHFLYSFFINIEEKSIVLCFFFIIDFSLLVDYHIFFF